MTFTISRPQAPYRLQSGEALIEDHEDSGAGRSSAIGWLILLCGVGLLIWGGRMAAPVINSTLTYRNPSLPGGGPADFLHPISESDVDLSLIGLCVMALAMGLMVWGRLQLRPLQRGPHWFLSLAKLGGNIRDIILFAPSALLLVVGLNIPSHRFGWTHDQFDFALHAVFATFFAGLLAYVTWVVVRYFLPLLWRRGEREADPEGWVFALVWMAAPILLVMVGALSLMVSVYVIPMLPLSRADRRLAWDVMDVAGHLLRWWPVVPALSAVVVFADQWRRKRRAA